jgi:hypothetical protein
LLEAAAISSIRGDLSTLRADENLLPPFGRFR